MLEWIKPLVVIVILILLIRSFYLPIARRRAIRSAWQAIAEELGWIFFADQGREIGSLHGLWQSRTFTVKAFPTTARSDNPKEFVDFIAPIATPLGLSLFTRLPEPLVNDEAGAWRKLFDRVKSGDILFDNSYSFAGYPKDDVKRVLANAEIRLAIKAIYPLNAPIFVHPIVHLADGQIGIRLPKPLTQKSEIQGYVEKLDKLAELIEKEFGVNN